MTEYSTPRRLPRLSDAAPASRSATHRPRVFLHIGEPKTGTTFLQQVMWRNRAALAAQGVVLPGQHSQDHFRASHDLREVPKPADDPASAWDGEWELLAREAAQATGTAVMSHELFCAVDAHQVDRALRSLRRTEVHLILTVRDIASLLPAEWQETIKHRNDLSWEDWLTTVIDDEAHLEDRRRYWFWRVHDSAAILAVWARHVPPERVHVITVPPAGSAPGLLWERFAGVIGVDPDSVDLSRADTNSSLGVPEIEFLRRVNHELPDEIPEWFYMGSVKEAVAQRALSTRPRVGRIVLPAERDQWAAKEADTLIRAVLDARYDVVGDLEELRPERVAQDGIAPGEQSAEQMLEAAIVTVVALLVNQYRRTRPAVRPRGDLGATTGLIGRVESAVAASPKLTRTVRDLSGRYPAVRRLRALAGRSTQRSRTRGDA